MQTSCALCGANSVTAQNRRADELERALRDLTQHMTSVNFKSTEARAERFAQLEQTVREQSATIQVGGRAAPQTPPAF